MAAPLTEMFLDQLMWKGSSEYDLAERKIWHVPGDPEVAGYAKKALNLQQVRPGTKYFKEIWKSPGMLISQFV